MNIFNIKQEYHALKELVEDFEIDENGEFVDRSETIAEMLEDLQGTSTEKLENIEYIKKEIKGGSELLKAEIAKLSAKKKTLENREKHLKELQIALLHEMDDNKCKTEKNSFFIKKTETLQISDSIHTEDLPFEFVTAETTYKPNKNELKKAIKKGLYLDGVNIIENESLGVR